MKHLTKILISLAFFGLSMSSALAQSYEYEIFLITGKGYVATGNGGGTNPPVTLQAAIDWIKGDANGNDCTIQFGSSGNVLDLGSGNATLITFTGNWGKITLTGKATMASTTTNGNIRLESGIAIDCKAELEHTATPGRAIFNNSTGTVNISGGTISSTYMAICNNSTGTVNISGGTISSTHIAVYNSSTGEVNISGGTISSTYIAVYNSSTGEVNISGGTISSTTIAVGNSSTGEVNISGGTVTSAGDAIYNNVGTINISGTAHISTTATEDFSAINNNSTGAINITGGTVSGGSSYAIFNKKEGKITISGDAVVTSENTDYLKGTIHIADNGTATDCRLEISGGTIENTATDGNAIYNASTGAINIGGGTVKATTGMVILNNNTGALNISGGEIVSTEGNAIHNASTGTININGGNFSSISGSAIYNDDAGNVNISGGKILSTNGNAIYNHANGTININGGDFLSTDGSAVHNASTGAINITGGTISGGSSYAIFNNDEGKITISGNAVVTSGISDFLKGTIHLANNGTATAERLIIAGGMVKNTSIFGRAILNESTGAVIITSGIVFAGGTELTDIISGNHTYNPSGNGVLIAWDKEAGRIEYEANTSDDIFKFPESATAVWTKEGANGGIAVSHKGNNGFIAIEEVTIGGVGIVETHGSASPIQVYPNPTRGELIIEICDMRYEICDIAIFDTFGRKLQVSNLKSQISNHKIDISHLPSGIYFLRIQTENGVVTRKIIKN